MAMCYQLFLPLGIFIVVVVAGPQGGPPPQFANLPEECRPKRPEPGQQREVCCQLPRISMADNDRAIFKECAESVGMRPPPDGGRPGGPRGPRGPPGNMPCLAECTFDKKGLLTGEKKLNLDAVMKEAIRDYGADTAWKTVVEGAANKCVQTAPADVPTNGTCKSGSHEFHRCFYRFLYMNCPGGMKTESDTCTAERALMERCPNMRPPHPRPI